MSVTVETAAFDHIREFNKHFPIVFFDRVCNEINTAKITTNDFECGYMATRHLIEAGCKKIALISLSNSLFIISERTEGYKKAIAELGINESDFHIIDFPDEPGLDYEIIKDMMTGADRPDGIVATGEKLTTPIYLVAQQMGIKIPEEVKIVCFSNQSSAIILNPTLSTITQPAFEMGKTAASVLLKSLKYNSLILKEESTIIPSQLIPRGSTAL